MEKQNKWNTKIKWLVGVTVLVAIAVIVAWGLGLFSRDAFELIAEDTQGTGCQVALENPVAYSKGCVNCFAKEGDRMRAWLKENNYVRYPLANNVPDYFTVYLPSIKDGKISRPFLSKDQIDAFTRAVFEDNKDDQENLFVGSVNQKYNSELVVSTLLVAFRTANIKDVVSRYDPDPYGLSGFKLRARRGTSKIDNICQYAKIRGLNLREERLNF